MSKQLLCWAVLTFLSVPPALAQFNSGSDGSDGSFAPSQPDTVIDLSLAATGSWDMPSPVPGQGVYDPSQWAVVFKYTTVDIPADVTVKFKNHSSGAPVVWLASGDVDIYGVVDLDGEDGFDTLLPFECAEPGPGGFAGGLASFLPELENSGGFGPGGAPTSLDDRHGLYASGSRAYGSANIIPLIGGSGGRGYGSRGGGAGGGAILIASSGSINLLTIAFPPTSGGIRACGGARDYPQYTGAGSGGAIRLIANQIAGMGTLDATGGEPDNDGRIRLEAYTNNFTGSSDPAYTFSGPGFVFPPSNAPALRVTTIAGVSAPSDPLAGVRDVDVLVPDSLVLVNIEAENIPTGTEVTVLVKPAHGNPFSVTSQPLAGTLASSTTQAVLSLPDGPVEIQLRANWTP